MMLKDKSLQDRCHMMVATLASSIKMQSIPTIRWLSKSNNSAKSLLIIIVVQDTQLAARTF